MGLFRDSLGAPGELVLFRVSLGAPGECREHRHERYFSNMGHLNRIDSSASAAALPGFDELQCIPSHAKASADDLGLVVGWLLGCLVGWWVARLAG